MNISTVLDPLSSLKESNSLKECSVVALIARVKGGKPVNSQMVGTITNSEGKPLSYNQVISLFPRELLTPEVDRLIRTGTMQAGIDNSPSLGMSKNVYGHQVFK